MARMPEVIVKIDADVVGALRALLERESGIPLRIVGNVMADLGPVVYIERDPTRLQAI
jgi:hypothetical protein